jgi:hypothetical protein
MLRKLLLFIMWILIFFHLHNLCWIRVARCESDMSIFAHHCNWWRIINVRCWIADAIVEILLFAFNQQMMIGYQFTVWKPIIIYIKLITHQRFCFWTSNKRLLTFFYAFQINFTFKLQPRHGCTVSDQLNRKMGFFHNFSEPFSGWYMWSILRRVSIV